MSAEGLIEFLGRKDLMVKVRGYRVQLETVDAALQDLPGVKEAVAAAQPLPDGGKHLVAYLVAAGERPPSVSDVRASLSRALPANMMPTRIVFLPALPTTPSGKVDRQALPEPESARPRLGGAALPPRNTLELLLTGIWERVFGIRPIGVRDDFFDLGGHSVLAMEIFSEIQKHTGRALPVTTLLETPTIEGLARRLRQEGWSTSRSSLVPIQPLGANPPLFYVPPAAMTVLPLRKLAEYLGPEQPVYGFEPLGLDGAASPQRRVQDMAACYIAQMRRLQPEGPYFLAGQCFGGVVVFEMAQQLRENAQEVALLARLDSIRAPRLRDEPRRPATRGARAARAWWRFARRVRAGGRLVALYLAGRGRRLNGFVRRRARRLFRGFLPLHQRRLQRVVESHVGAMGVYRARVYPGTITCFWSQKTEAAVGGKGRWGWRVLAAKGLEIHWIPCAHMRMLREPYVRMLAQKMEACIEKARSSQRRPTDASRT